MKSLVVILAVASCTMLLSCSKKPVGIVEKQIAYSGGGVSMKGYLAYDGDIAGPRPGILVVHEWWGQTEYPRERARMLARLGYVAFAVDMFGDGKIADRPDSARSYAMDVMQHLDSAKERFLAARNVLASQPECDTARIGAIGYCFGGGVVLTMAMLGVPLDGIVSFHGGLSPQPPPGSEATKTKVLVCNGAADPFNPPPAIAQFRKWMDSLGVDYKFIDYPGATHAFSNPEADSLGKLFNMPIAYNAAADKESWGAMQEFFKGVFGR